MHFYRYAFKVNLWTPIYKSSNSLWPKQWSKLYYESIRFKNAQRVSRNHWDNSKNLTLNNWRTYSSVSESKLWVAVCRGQIEVPVRLALKNMTLKSRSGADASSQKPNSSVHLFSEAFSVQNSQSLSIEPSNVTSQPSRDWNGQFNFQDGEFHSWKACLQCSCTDVRGNARFTLWNLHAMFSFSLCGCGVLSLRLERV